MGRSGSASAPPGGDEQKLSAPRIVILRVIAQIGHAVAHQLAGPKEPHQGDGIAAVGPDPITWLPRDQ